MTIEKDNGLRGDKAIRIVKQIDGDGSDADLTLLISTDGMDEEGDVVEQDWEIPSQVPFLFAHNSRTLPVGHLVNPRVLNVASLPQEVRRNLSEDAQRATVADVDIDTDDPFAAAVLRKYQRGDMEDSSVGFDPLEFEEFGDDEPGRFHFIRQTLKEVSATPIGANSDTTVLSKAFDPDVIPEALKGGDDKQDKRKPDRDPVGERDSGGGRNMFHAREVEKEGRRNSKMDEKVQEHIKECAEFLKGDKGVDEMKGCPFHKGGDMDDDKSDDGALTRKQIREIVAEEVAKHAEPEEGGEGADDEPEPSKGLSVVGKDGQELKIVGSQEKSEEPGSSSGDDSEQVIDIDELFAH